MSIVNWLEVQEYFDQGKTHIETAGKFKISMSDLRQAEMKGFFKTVSLSQSRKPREIVVVEKDENEESIETKPIEKTKIILKKEIVLKGSEKLEEPKTKRLIDWKEIQEYYDRGNSYKETAEKFKIDMNVLTRGNKKGVFVSRSRSEACKLREQKKSKKIDWIKIQKYYDKIEGKTTYIDLMKQFDITYAHIKKAETEGNFIDNYKYDKYDQYDNLDWVEIQSYYNNEHTIRDIIKHFTISKNMIQKAIKNGDFKSRTLSEASKLANRKYPRKHTIETKKKLSAIRIKYLRENPHIIMFPKNGESYPEKYFKECLKNSSYKPSHRFLQYELDFADIERKINLEIDGEQHFTTKKSIKHDEMRNKALTDLGWKVIRVRWRKFIKLSKQEKQIIIFEIIKGGDDFKNDGSICVFNGILNSLAIAKYQEDIKKKNPKCPGCNAPVCRGSKVCKECYMKKRNFNPDKKEFENFLEDGMTVPELAKHYNFSKKTIRKKMNTYGFERFLKTSTRFNPDREELMNLLKEGNTLTDLCKYYKRDFSTVKNKIKELDLEGYLKKKKVFNPDKEEMLELLENGKKPVDLAKHYNVSPGIIRNRMKKFNLGHFIGVKKCTKIDKPKIKVNLSLKK